MLKHNCEALVITCIDYRFQEYIAEWLKKNFCEEKYDQVSLAGGIFDFYSILRQVEISNSLHHIHKVVLINHEDCGAYGKENNFSRHENDLREAERKIEALFPQLDVEAYYLTIKGEFVEVSRTNPRRY
ncbi:hypothetical protein HY345_02530 [Candidatus Microgenomates bacterium]|nr:hypothetical protein [Candidatus Microgenomates bacterium]